MGEPRSRQAQNATVPNLGAFRLRQQLLTALFGLHARRPEDQRQFSVKNIWYSTRLLPAAGRRGFLLPE